MKKTVALLLMLTLLAVSFTACGTKSETITKAATVEGAIFGGKSDDKIAVDVKFNPDWITSANNKKYNAELAQFCALLSTDSYYREKDVAKGTQNRVLLTENAAEEYTATTLLSSFGFTDAEHYESFKVLEDPTDSDDSVTLNIGHQTVNNTDVYVVVIRGCFSWQEWSSAFDPGCVTEAYEQMTGTHPDWTHKNYQKGIDIAANRAISFIQQFMSKYNDTSLKDTILLTGHSRGGTIANVLGAHFENEKDVKSYTYTFNAVPAVKEDNAGKYRTIFNIFDEDDFFTDLFPYADQTFYRFGTDVTLSVSENQALKNKIAEIKGRDDAAALSKEARSEYRKLFAERFPTRETLCDSLTYTRIFEEEATAKAALDEITALISADNGLGLENLVSVSEISKNEKGQYVFSITSCGLALLRSYAKILAYGSAVNTAVQELFTEDTTGCRIAELINDNAEAINAGHLMITSYVLAGEEN